MKYPIAVLLILWLTAPADAQTKTQVEEFESFTCADYLVSFSALTLTDSSEDTIHKLTKMTYAMGMVEGFIRATYEAEHKARPSNDYVMGQHLVMTSACNVSPDVPLIDAMGETFLGDRGIE